MILRTNLMEITSKLTHSKTNSSSQNRKAHRRHGCVCVQSSTIRLSLHKPHRKILQPVKDPTKELILTTAATNTSSDILRLLDCLGFPVPDALYISFIKECTHFRDPNEALVLYAHLTRNRRNQPRLPLLNRILIMFVSCGCIHNAQQVFDEMSKRDLNSWAIMIAAYADSGDYEEVIKLFTNSELQYLINGSSRFPVSWILVCVLKASANTLNLELGKQIHGWLLKTGYADDIFVGSSLINLYTNNEYSHDGDLVFDHISCHNVVVWTAKITKNCKEGRFHEVLDVFKEMGKVGIRKNSFTFSSVLSACAKITDDGNCGEQVHANAIKLGLTSKSYVQSGLVNMYGKFGLIEDAKRAFNMNEGRRNNACWNSMFTSLIQNGCRVEAIKFLYQMKAAGVQPQDVWLDKLRSLCGSLEIKRPNNSFSSTISSTSSSVLGTRSSYDDTSSNSTIRNKLREKLKMEMSGTMDSKSELEKFLKEGVKEDSDKFDILLWWKVNSPRFPILSLMARDLLVIPVSTVASESVFSRSGRVIDPFRSSLTPTIVEALICTQDWLRISSKQDVEEDWEQKQEIDEGIYENI
ncbi:hypothetical protein LXL04_029009 [Taraxacum kok-saghyz]